MSDLLHLTAENIKDGRMPSGPRLRVNRTAALVMSQTWQRIDFSGTSPLYNVNLFPLTNGVADVRWDSTSKLFRFNKVDMNYTLTMDFTFSGGLRPVDIAYRFVVPAPTPIYFPNPEGTQQGTLISIERLTAQSVERSRTVYVTSSMVQYGLGIELFSQTLLGVQPSLIACNVLIAK